MNTILFVPALFGLLSAAGVWLCFWWQRIGWTLTLASNLLLICYGAYTGQWGFSLAVPLAAAAQLHHLYRSRDEAWTARRRPIATRRVRTRRHLRMFRHEPAMYAPGRAPVGDITATAVMSFEPILSPDGIRVVGVACPCGCGAFAPSDFVGHLERNRGNINHWAVANRR